MQVHWNNFINNVRLRRTFVLMFIVSVLYFVVK